MLLSLVEKEEPLQRFVSKAFHRLFDVTFQNAMNTRVEHSYMVQILLHYIDTQKAWFLPDLFVCGLYLRTSFSVRLKH